MNTGAYGHIQMKITSNQRESEWMENIGELTELIQWHDSLWGEASANRGGAEWIKRTLTHLENCEQDAIVECTEQYGSNEQYTLNELHTN
jgi:hypothetical protein